MSEDEKVLTDAYYWLSMYKSGATTEEVAMEKVKEAIFDQPQLNDNQQIVLGFLKNEYNGSTMINPMALIFVLHDEVGKDSEIDAVEAYIELSGKEEAQVLQAFSHWALEQEVAE